MNVAKVFAVSIQGENHKKLKPQEKPCQDYSYALLSEQKYVEYFTVCNSTWVHKPQKLLNPLPRCCIAIVADGHGDDEFIRSDRGSHFACESARVCIIDFLKKQKKKPTEENIHQLIKSIIKTWNEKVVADLGLSPFGNSELSKLPNDKRGRYLSDDEYSRHAYGTTLIAAVKCDTYWFGFHIGDGKCVVLNKNAAFFQPIPWDDRCFLNVTTSICDEDAAERARVRVLPDEKDNYIPIATFLCSDGLDDSYPVNDNEKYLAKFYRALALNFMEKDFEASFDDVKETLPLLSKKGSGDDISISCILDIDSISKLKPYFDEQIAKEKEEKLSQEKNEQSNLDIDDGSCNVIINNALKEIRKKEEKLNPEYNNVNNHANTIDIKA
jgi:serine/threonine protein phosphatase PrpC